MHNGRLHLYFGDGKGKTSAAMGLAIRFLGHGKRVLIAQFIKNGRSGELNALLRFENAVIADMPKAEKFTFQMSSAEITAFREANKQAANELIHKINELEPHLTVLDEIAAAAYLGMLDETATHSVINAALECGEVCATGFKAPESLIARADYASEIVKRRHPFDNGLQARECVEW